MSSNDGYLDDDMRLTRSEYRAAKVRHIASIIIEARPSYMESVDEKNLEPDEYRSKYGRCPRGFRFSNKEGKCIPRGAGKEAPVEEKKPKKKKKLTRKQHKQQKQTKEKIKEERRLGFDVVKDPDTGKKKKVPTKRQKALLDLAETDHGAYSKEIKRMRETGELPSREISELMVKIDNVDQLPKNIKNNPKKLRKVLQQQEAQRAHEETELKRTIDYIEDFEVKRERAIEMGEDPPKMNWVKLFNDLEENYGRSLNTNKEEVKDFLSGDKGDTLSQGIKSKRKPKPGSLFDNLSKWWRKATQPQKRLRGIKASVEGGVMSAHKMQSVLDEVAAELDKRGAKKLATIVDAEASGYPEADVLPDGASSSEWDLDFELQTGDYGEELGYPPYNKRRPGTKGDEGKD